MTTRDIQLAILLCVSSQDPKPQEVCELYSAFSSDLHMTTFAHELEQMFSAGKLVQFELDGKMYVQISEKLRKRMDEMLGPPEEVRDPLQELLLMVDCVINKHMAKGFVN